MTITSQIRRSKKLEAEPRDSYDRSA